MNILSFSPFGYEGSLVRVEVDLRRGIPAVDIVGLADGAVKESRERMRSAIRNSGFDFPPERVLISLSPADLKKEGAGFDLAVALAVLSAKKSLDFRERASGGDAACGSDSAAFASSAVAADSDVEADADCGDSVLVMGELELNGAVRPVRGIHAAVSTAVAGGVQLCIVPEANAREAREVCGSKVFCARNLTEAFYALYNRDAFSGKGAESALGEDSLLPEGAVNIGGVWFCHAGEDLDITVAKGQGFLTRALQVAAAGGHNVLAFGPPGCGKTLSLQRFPSLVPLLTPEEAQSVTRIYSIAGLLPPESPAIRIAPFRMPHQTATIEGMCGGGPRCSPGEISLAHNGVLFLDEAAEFRSSVLQMLRIPLESGRVTLSRAGRSTTFPADFQLLLATNPCPCGFYGSRDRLCLCSSHSVEQYWKKISGPLLDRVDIRVQVDLVKDKSCCNKGLSLEELRLGVANAVTVQRERQGKKNAKLSPEEVTLFCRMTDKARVLLDSAALRYDFSPRAVSSCMKLSRTIADIAGKELIDELSMKEAVSYRKCEGGLLM
ncbi:MAG: ATP-binding protein [Treponema sp.]|nr:ATP-binding protein [Treponema sp.]